MEKILIIGDLHTSNVEYLENKIKEYKAKNPTTEFGTKFEGDVLCIHTKKPIGKEILKAMKAMKPMILHDFFLHTRFVHEDIILRKK